MFPSLASLPTPPLYGRLFSYSHAFKLPQQKYLVSPASRYSHQILSLCECFPESVPLSCLFLRLWFTSPLFTGFSVLFWPGCPFSPSCSHGTLCRHHLSCRRHRDYLLIVLLSSKFLEDQGHSTFILKFWGWAQNLLYNGYWKKNLYLNEWIYLLLIASKKGISLIWILEKSLL